MKPYKRPHKEPVKTRPDDIKDGQVMSATVSSDSITVNSVAGYPKLGIYRNRKKGFTLIEVLISLAIIAIVSAMAVPNMMKRVEYKRKLATIENTKTLNNAVHDWFLQHEKQETTFGHSSDSGKWNSLESLITGGFENCEVVGYEFTPEGLNGCYISIIQFKGVMPDAVYRKY